jgi:hypothetical protein
MSGVLRRLTGALLLCLVLAAPAAAAERWVDEADLASLIKPILTPEGVADPAFYAAVAHPQPYYGDFFGVLALRDTSRDRIVRDFTPAYAEVAGEDAHSIALKFKAGYTVRFVPHSAFGVKSATASLDHAYVEGATWRETRANLGDFLAILERARLERAYLIPNPFYRIELDVARRMVSPPPAAEVIADPQLETFDRTRDAVLLQPEGVHGQDGDYRKLAAVLAAHDVDWVGLEMLPTTMQPTLDAFSRGPRGGKTYDAARAALIAYFAESWNGRAGPRTSGEENYYFKLVDLARARGARVVGLEGVPLDYILFRYGETPFGGAVRSERWADAAPRTGRGVIFGGSAHFTAKGSHNVQDFPKRRSPRRVFVSLSPLEAR